MLSKLKDKNLNLCLHLCGSIARNVWKTGSWNEVETIFGKNLGLFSRIQLNVCTDKVPKYLKEGLENGEWLLAMPPQNQKVIIQQSSRNSAAWEAFTKVGLRHMG